MAEPFIGEIMMFGGNFAPRGWALCEGQLLQISQNDALFALLGTIYGGDGRTTFGLPDLRGRTPIHQGQGIGLTRRNIGSRLGAERVILTELELPTHDHDVRANGNRATQASPANGLLADRTRGDMYFAEPLGTPSTVNMAAGSVGNTGDDQGHNNMQPSLVINFCIALTGIFPSRN